MTNKIQELTEKIYNEGVVKAKSDAEQIVAEAKNEAAEIVKTAKRQRVEIIEQAKSEAAEMQEKAGAEMQLAARQFVSHLKQQIERLIVAQQIGPSLKESFNDTEWVKNIITELVKNWNPQNTDGPNLQVIIAETEKSRWFDFLNDRALKMLDQGVEIQLDTKMKNGFRIGPKDGSYFIRFSDEDFENYFKGYFKEKTRELLFGSDKNDN